MTSRALKIGDALSQLLNVALLRRHHDTDPNESTSGRCHWEARHGARHWSWRLAEQAIDALFWSDRDAEGRRHCERADLRDYERAVAKVRRFEERQRPAANPADGGQQERGHP